MPTDFFSTKNSPYYILAPDYRYSSGGIRALHALCHILNQMGHEAYIANPISNFNPKLITPNLSSRDIQRHRECNLNPIAVYPEVVNGNPFNLPTIARWMLNKPGHLSGQINFSDNEIAFWWDKWTGADEVEINMLQLPVIDRSIFSPPPKGSYRKGYCYYANKFFTSNRTIDTEIIRNGIRLCQDVPLTKEDIATILRQTEILYTYEPTALAGEAVACGCKVAYVESGYLKEFNLDQPDSLQLPIVSEHQILHGFAPKMDIQEFLRQLLQIEKSATRQLKNFIDVTQRAAQKQKDPVSFDSLIGIIQKNTQRLAVDHNSLYLQWRESDESDLVRSKALASSMMMQWRTSPGVHFFIAAFSENIEEIFKTISSLSTQVFRNWMLTVVSTSPLPADLVSNQQMQWLHARQSGDIASILHEMAKASGGDWVGFLTPGITMEPLALQSIMDAAQRNANWELIYSDDDVQSEDGRAYKPRLKPKVDPITLAGASFLDGLTVIKQSAYCREAPPLTSGCSPVYWFGMKLAVQGATDSIGHVDGIWAHLPKAIPAPTNEAERHVAERAMSEVGLYAQVLNRGVAGLRMVVPPAGGANPSVTLVVLGSPELEACLSHWRAITNVMGNQRPNRCLIVNRHLTRPEAQLLRMALQVDNEPSTEVIDVCGLDEGEALAEVSALIHDSWIWILTPGSAPTSADTLKQLTEWTNWPNVAAVQPALWSSRSKSLVCPGFNAALAWLELPLPADTTGNIPTQQRLLSGLQADGALVNTWNLRQALETMTSIERTHWPLSFSRQLAARGLQIVWKPEAVCLLNQEKSNALVSQMSTRFLSRHLSWLTSDGAYNPRLSLRRPASVDPQRSVPWIDLPDSARRCLLIQEEGSLFPNDHLTHLGRLVELTDSSSALWTVLADDSWQTLFLEIVRAYPSYVYFSHLTHGGTLSEALCLLKEHAPEIGLICCTPSPTDSSTAPLGSRLVDWMIRQKRAAVYATQTVTTQGFVAEALHSQQTNVHLFAPTEKQVGKESESALRNAYFSAPVRELS